MTICERHPDYRGFRCRSPDGVERCFACYRDAVFASRPPSVVKAEKAPPVFYKRFSDSYPRRLTTEEWVAALHKAKPVRPIKELRTHVEHAAKAYKERKGW